MDILGWARKVPAPAQGSATANPQTPAASSSEKTFTYPEVAVNGAPPPPMASGASTGNGNAERIVPPSPQRVPKGPNLGPSSLITSLQPLAGPPSAVANAINPITAAGASFFGVGQTKEAVVPAVKKSVMRIRVATSAGTLLVPAPEDSTIAWLLAEAHARLHRFDKEDDDEKEQRQVFTTARSMLGDFIDVSDMVGDILTDGETLIGLTEIESRYAPKDLHPMFSSIMEKAVMDPVYHQMKNRRPRESAEIFIFSNEEDDEAPPPPSKIEEEDEGAEDEEARDVIADIKPSVVGIDELKFVARRSSVRSGRKLSNAGDISAVAAAAAAAAANKKKKAVTIAPPGSPALTIETAVAQNLLEVLTRVPHPTRETALVLSWVPCVVEVVGEGDDEGFMQVRFVEGDRVEVVGVERLRIIQKKATGGDVLAYGDVEVLVKNDESVDQYLWLPGTVVSYGMGAKASRMSSFTISVRLQTSARPATEEDDETVPIVTVPVWMVRLPGNPAVSAKDDAFAAAVTSMVADEDFEEEECETAVAVAADVVQADVGVEAETITAEVPSDNAEVTVEITTAPEESVEPTVEATNEIIEPAVDIAVAKETASEIVAEVVAAAVEATAVPSTDVMVVTTVEETIYTETAESDGKETAVAEGVTTEALDAKEE
ncbi:hypothetical protein HDU67_008597 [Dinochytrium kinnereticum]|nr:hypothetical protein HDU67_008597 [Dinochytrium kinnereticum]